MKAINWIKEKWTKNGWDTMFSAVILAIITPIIQKLFHYLNLLIASKTIQNLFSNFNNWLSEESQISNLILLLLLLFVGLAITLPIYNLITKRWIGRTDKFYASDKSFTVRGTYSVDLDLGIQAKGRTDSDFFWQQKSNTERSIVPKNGAQFCVIGQSSNNKTTKEELSKLTFSSQEIHANDNHSNKIPVGTQVAYKTKQGRLGIMKILKYGYNLEIEFYTLKKENE